MNSRSALFWAHLDELRSRTLKSLAVFIAACAVSFYCVPQVLPWIIKPAGRLVFTAPAEGFSATVTLTVVMGFILSFPFVLYQLWAFVRGALKPEERILVLVFAPLSLLFFIFGVAFAFWAAIPLSYNFLMGFSSEYLVPMISVGNYLSFVGNMVMVFGLTFELPLVLAFLASIGIATPEFLRQKRRHAVMIILIVAAVLTPPDIVSQVLLALPLVFLYEVGIVLVRVCYRKKF